MDGALDALGEKSGPSGPLGMLKNAFSGLVTGLSQSLGQLPGIIGTIAASGGAGVAVTLALAAALALLAAAAAPVAAALIPITLGFTALGAAVAALPAAHKQASKDMGQLKDQFRQMAKAVQPEILTAFAEGMKIIQRLMPALKPLMKAAAQAVDEFLRQLLGWLKSPSGQAFIQWLKTDGPNDIKVFGRVMWNTAHFIGDALQFIWHWSGWLRSHIHDLFTLDIPAFLDILKEKWRIVFDQLQIDALRMVHGVLEAMSHIPFIGHYFKTAADDVGKQLDRMTADANAAQRNINADIAKIHPHTVNIDFASHLTGPGGHGGPLPGHAAGTSGAAPGWAWVGERGPELVRMRGGETVLPHGQSMRVARGYADGVLNFTDSFHPSVAAVERGINVMASTAESILTRAARRILSREVASGALPTGPASASAAIAQRYAASILGRFGWGMNQFPPLQALWNRESGWNAYAVNPSSGAYGIPQSLGHGHPFNLGDYVAQIWWGLRYIAGRYGSPAAAWGHELSAGWYDNGGWLPTGKSIAINNTGKPEPVGMAQHIVLEVVGNSSDPLVKWLKEQVRVRGGGNVQAAFGARGR
jgi:hypothetical protein